MKDCISNTYLLLRWRWPFPSKFCFVLPSVLIGFLKVSLLKDVVLCSNAGPINCDQLTYLRSFAWSPLHWIFCVSLQGTLHPTPPCSVPQDPDISGSHEQPPFLSGFQVGSASGSRWQETEGERRARLVLPVCSSGCLYHLHAGRPLPWPSSPVLQAGLLGSAHSCDFLLLHA